MKRRLLIGLTLICGLGAGPVLAQATPDPEQQRRLAEQKLKLVEMLVESPAARAKRDGQDAETVALVERGRELLKQARDIKAIALSFLLLALISANSFILPSNV